MIVKLKPFLTPNFVIPEAKPGARQEGWNPPTSIPLADVDAQELSDMCDQFRADVFRKAGKEDPLRSPRPSPADLESAARTLVSGSRNAEAYHRISGLMVLVSHDHIEAIAKALAAPVSPAEGGRTDA